MKGFSGSGAYILAFKQRLVHGLAQRSAVIASLGYDEVWFLKPSRPGDILIPVIDTVKTRPSSKQDGRGNVIHRLLLLDQNEHAALLHLDRLLAW